MKFTTAILGFTVIVALGTLSSGLSEAFWSQAELNLLNSLSINQLGTLPKDPSNAVANNEKAAVLGYQLFFDKRFSSNGEVACATCHAPEKYFADDQAKSEGIGLTNRKAPSLVGASFQNFFFWDGRADSQWAQALGPLESLVEHGGSRTQYAHLIFDHYKFEYEDLFGKMPELNNTALFPASAGPVSATDYAAWQSMKPENQEAITQIFVNIGKSIAAYERKLIPGISRFDAYVDKLVNPEKAGARSEDSTATFGKLNEDEIAGLKLFIGKAGCVKCHNGALLTDEQFHNTGVPTMTGLQLDLGREIGLQKLATSEFSCRSKYSNAAPEECPVAEVSESSSNQKNAKSALGAFKTPSLRSVNLHAPYMHSGQFSTLEQVLKHYNNALTAPTGKTEIKALNLSRLEMQQLEAFLKTLESPVKADKVWLQDPFFH